MGGIVNPRIGDSGLICFCGAASLLVGATDQQFCASCLLFWPDREQRAADRKLPISGLLGNWPTTWLRPLVDTSGIVGYALFSWRSPHHTTATQRTIAHGGFEALFSLRRFLRMVQPASVAGGAGRLRAGARLHDRASLRLGALGEHYGAARPALQGNRTCERGVSAADSAEFHQQGTVARGGVFARAGSGYAWRRRKTGRAAGHPPDFGEDHRPRLREMDSVVPRSAGADQSVEQRGAVGTAHEAVSSHARILLAGRPHGARDL